MHIALETAVNSITSRLLVRLPPSTSRALTSQGMMMAKGTLNGMCSITSLEPVGNGGYWTAVYPKTAKSSSLF